jgi:hypothetical protein
MTAIIQDIRLLLKEQYGNKIKALNFTLFWNPMQQPLNPSLLNAAAALHHSRMLRSRFSFVGLQ